MIVDVFDLWDFNGPFYLLNHRHLALLDNWDLLNFRNGNGLCHHLRDLSDVILDDWLLALHRFLDNFGLLYFDRLDLILDARVNNSVRDFWDLDDSLLDLDFGHFDGL